MGFLTRFRRNANRIEDPDALAGEEQEEQEYPIIDEPPEYVQPQSQDNHGGESEWESDESLEAIETPSDKRARRLRERNSKTIKIPVKPSIETKPSKLVPKPSQGLSIDLDKIVNQPSRRRISATPAFEAIMSELETTLLEADMGHIAVDEVLSEMRSKLIGSPLPKKGDVGHLLDATLVSALDSLLRVSYWDFDQTIETLLDEEPPVVIMLVGVNGTGKTTTAAKISYRLIQRGLSVVLGAADTFRAGAIDQLSDHAERIGARCVKSQRGGDSAAVARDAIDSAKARGDDVVIIDTAGRMQNKTNLMQELKKVHRVASPHIVLFVGDALAGNDAVEQARKFQSVLHFDGAVLTKLDTDARGGAALSIAHATNRPIVLAGSGQEYQDLIDFEPVHFLTKLLSEDIDPSAFKIFGVEAQ